MEKVTSKLSTGFHADRIFVSFNKLFKTLCILFQCSWIYESISTHCLILIPDISKIYPFTSAMKA